MLLTTFSVVAALAGPQVSAPSPSARLAEIPADLSIATDGDVCRDTFAPRRSIAWGADGRCVAYAARRGDGWLPVVGNEVGEVYDYVSAPRVAGGRAVFHVGNRRSESTQRSWIWVDGKTLPPQDWIGEFTVSADGKRIAFWTQPGARVGNAAPAISSNHFLVIATAKGGGGWSLAKGGRWLTSSPLPPQFDADAQLVFTTAADARGWRVLRAGRGAERAIGEAQSGIDAIAVDGSGKRLAVVAAGTLLVDGKQVAAERQHEAGVAVDARGRHVAVVVVVDGRRTVAVDDEAAPTMRFDHVRQIAFAPSGERLAFTANDGGVITDDFGAVRGGASFVVVRAVDGGEWERVPAGLEVRDLVWSTNGDALAYAARDVDGWRIVCGEAKSPAFDDVGPPQFAPDGRSIGFGAQRDRELRWEILQR